MRADDRRGFQPVGLEAVWLAVLMGILAAVGPRSAPAADSFEKFVGSYAGTGVSNSQGELNERDLSVEIRAAEDRKGFAVKWTTVTKKSDGRIKRKKYEVRFVPTRNDNVFASAMRNNMFGRPVPLDPLKGDPYVWATINGDTLKVHALIITGDFGYEMQVYDRTLSANGLTLSFARVRDGVRLRDVTAELVRLPD